jgi:hypothetical protein
MTLELLRMRRSWEWRRLGRSRMRWSERVWASRRRRRRRAEWRGWAGWVAMAAGGSG